MGTFLFSLAILIGVIAGIVFKFYRGYKQSDKGTAKAAAFLVASIAAPFTAIIMAVNILHIPSSTAALGFLFLPVYAFIGGLLCYVITWSVVTVYLTISGKYNRAEKPSISLTVISLMILAVTVVLLAHYTHNQNLVGLAKVANENEIREIFTDPDNQNNRQILFTLARNKNCPPDILLAMATNTNPVLRTRPDNILHDTRGDNISVMQMLAKHENLPVEAMNHLAENGPPYAAAEIAKHPDAPVETLRRLIQFKHYAVSYSLSHNTNTPPDILHKLASDHSELNSEYTRSNVAGSTSTLPDTLTLLSKDRNKFVRRMVARNPNTPVEILRSLAHDSEGEVRFYLAINEATPEDILRQLSTDSDARAKRTAENKLATLKRDQEIFKGVSN